MRTLASCAACGLVLLAAVATARADTTIIPLPEILTDPNEGTTVGVLATFLNTDEKTIRSIIAPDVRYNPTTGVYPTLRFFHYPTAEEKLVLIGGKGISRGEYAEASYTGEKLLQGWLDARGSGWHEQDPYERFFGIGNNTPDSNETNFQSTTNAATVFAGLNLPASFQSWVQARIRQVRIGTGGVDSLPQLRDPSSGLANVNGVDGATIIGTRFGVAYDTRDRIDVTTQGVLATTSIEVVDQALGSSASFIKYGLESKAYLPLRRDKKYIVALRGALDYLTNGDQAPFYELNSVGGIHSLRGFGSNRFTDNDRFVFQAELRSNLYEREIFGVRAHLEVAPFVDLAKVFHSSREFPLENLHPVGGMGFRAVVIPQVVAYVDVGTSGGSPSAFTGIDYPF